MTWESFSQGCFIILSAETKLLRADLEELGGQVLGRAGDGVKELGVTGS